MIEWLDTNFISLLNGVAIGLLLFMIAVGLSLIFGMMDVLNLAHGAVFLLGGYVAVDLSEGRVSLLPVIGAVAIGALLGGALSGAVRPIGGRGYLDQALLTLGVAFILSDTALWIWGTDPTSLAPPAFLDGSVTVIGHRYPTYRLAVIVVGVVVAVGLYLAFERTRLGARVRAAVADREMASAVGINVGRLRIGVFAAGSALAGFAGALGTPILGVAPGLDGRILMLALIVVVVGGLGSLRGALVAALLIGQVQSLGVSLFPEIASFMLFGTMAVVLAVRPAGLFGRVA